jgi:peptidoglycan/LPS O-acetylase OafA/YrhL
MVPTVTSQTSYGASPAGTPPRDLYIDRLRTVLTVVVIVCHAAMTYGGMGEWFYRELQPSSRPTSGIFTFFIGISQAYSMGFFFLLAGYFTPGALERKGYARFLQDRFLRLGLPLLAFIVILGPLTVALINWALGYGFWPTIVWLWRHHRIMNGPLWFAEALLIFSLSYAAWRAVFGSSLLQRKRDPRPMPGYSWWLASALAVGAATTLVRLVAPIPKAALGLVVGYFVAYAFLFAVGITAWRHDWLRQLTWKNARIWIVTLMIALPALPVAYALTTLRGVPASFNGGMNWTSALYAFWEPFVAWGLICLLLLVFRERMNQPSAFWDWLNRRAYAVYILHSLVLVGITLLFRHWAALAVVKCAVTSCLACVACWLIADPIVRLPGIRRIV